VKTSLDDKQLSAVEVGTGGPRMTVPELAGLIEAFQSRFTGFSLLPRFYTDNNSRRSGGRHNYKLYVVKSIITDGREEKFHETNRLRIKDELNAFIWGYAFRCEMTRTKGYYEK